MDFVTNSAIGGSGGDVLKKNALAVHLLRVMRLTAFILLVFALAVSAKSVSQNTVSYSGRNVPIGKVFNEIKKQTGYVVVTNKERFDRSQKIDVTADRMSIADFMQMILEGKPWDFEIRSKTIFIKEKPAAQQKTSELNAVRSPQGDVTGRVTNAQGEPLAGASVIVKRTGKGDIADANGNFRLKNVNPDDVLEISFTGYKTLSAKVAGASVLALVLDVAVDELDRAVVQAYGKTTQRFATGNIGVVTAKEIEKQPVMNPLLALQGRVAGLDIQQNNGYASAPIKAEIRGRSYVDPSQTNDPLYIIDGVPLTVVNVGGNSGYGSSTGFLQNGYLLGPAGGQSPLFSINLSDIESISVLKDADATSIYGSRGANGVILITTKRGQSGKTKLNIRIEEGVNKITRYWKMLHTAQYLEMRREAINNDGYGAYIGDPAFDQYWPELTVWDTARYTDWQKYFYGKAGRVINTQLSLSGGNSFTTFRLSSSYTNSRSITTASGADERGTVGFNLIHNSSNRRFSLSLTSTYSFTKSDLINVEGKINLAPNAPAIFDSTGKLNWDDWRSVGGNRFTSLLQPYTSKTNFLNSNLIFSYQPINRLLFTVNLGFNVAQANQSSLIPIASQDPLSQPIGSAYFGNNNNKNYIVEPQISYETQIGSSKLSFLAGGSAQLNTTDGIYLQGQGYTSDALLQTISNAPNQFSRDNYGEYRYASVFGRVGYNLRNKYILNLSARRDGSSNYGPDHQYGNFASIGGAWLFTEETWFKKHNSFLSFGKLRGSYGITGSDGGIPYGYITRWNSNGYSPYGGTVPLVATQHANPDYHWQQNKKLEGAADLGFFKDWITINVAYYRNRTNNQLLSLPTPWLSGFPSVIDNLNALVENSGWEFTIGGKGVHIRSKYFNWDWSPRLTFSINKNKFVSFTGRAAAPYQDAGKVGRPLNGRYLLHYIGVDPQTGVYQFEDKNHDGVIDPNYGPNGDVYFKKASPTFSTGFGFNFDVKGISIALFFVAKKQEGVNAYLQGGGGLGAFNANSPVEVLARWQNRGDNTNVGKFSILNSSDPSGYLGMSDFGYTDASFIRLQNLSLSYNLLEKIARKGGFECNIFVNASNLLTITKYKGIDPETQSFGSMPPAKTITGGLSFNF